MALLQASCELIFLCLKLIPFAVNFALTLIELSLEIFLKTTNNCTVFFKTLSFGFKLFARRA